MLLQFSHHWRIKCRQLMGPGSTIASNPGRCHRHLIQTECRWPRLQTIRDRKRQQETTRRLTIDRTLLQITYWTLFRIPSLSSAPIGVSRASIPRLSNERGLLHEQVIGRSLWELRLASPVDFQSRPRRRSRGPTLPFRPTRRRERHVERARAVSIGRHDRMVPRHHRPKANGTAPGSPGSGARQRA